MTDPQATIAEGHRLTALLGAVDTVGSVDEAGWVIAEWTSEAFEAEVVAVLLDGDVMASLGGADIDLEDLASTSERTSIRSSSLGDVHLHAVPLSGVKGALVVGRIGREPFTPAEQNLLRGVSRVTSLVLRLLQSFEMQVRLRLEESRR